MAPEVIFGQMYSASADYYSLGVLLLLMTTGDMLSIGKTLNEAKQCISIRKDNINTERFSKRYPSLSQECWDLMVKLLATNPDQRIGDKNGTEEILEHNWFNDIDTDDIKYQTYHSPLYDIATSEENINRLIDWSSDKYTQYWKEREEKILKTINKTFIDNGEYYLDEFQEFIPANVIESDNEGKGRDSMMIMRNHTISSIHNKRDSVLFESPLMTNYDIEDTSCEHKISRAFKTSWSTASKELNSTNVNSV